MNWDAFFVEVGGETVETIPEEVEEVDNSAHELSLVKYRDSYKTESVLLYDHGSMQTFTFMILHVRMRRILHRGIDCELPVFC